MSFEPLDTGPDQDVGRLLVTCQDRPGISRRSRGTWTATAANITESHQYSTDPFGGTFFLRLEFYLEHLADRVAQLERDFAPVARSLGMTWRLIQASILKRVAIFASRDGHTLQELLWRTRPATCTPTSAW